MERQIPCGDNINIHKVLWGRWLSDREYTFIPRYSSNSHVVKDRSLGVSQGEVQRLGGKCESHERLK